MSIDYTALLGLSAGIQVVNADYDFTRDGGAQYSHDISSGLIPAGALVLGYVILTTVALTTATGATLYFQCNGKFFGPANPTLNYIYIVWPTNILSAPQDVPRAIEGIINSGSLLTGAAKLWLFYLPT